MRMNIRCCCDAGKLLGSVEVSHKTYDGDVITFSIPAHTYVMGGVIEQLSLPVGVATVRVASAKEYDEFGTGFKRGLAIKSMDTPIEKLRQIHTFVEAPTTKENK